MPPTLVDIASKMLRERRRRDRIFGFPGIFGEPTWDMLLDLYVHLATGRSVSVGSACIASCVAPTTALRYISVLEENGLIERQLDPADRRRWHLRLTLRARALMEEFLADRDRR